MSSPAVGSPLAEALAAALHDNPPKLDPENCTHCAVVIEQAHRILADPAVHAALNEIRTEGRKQAEVGLIPLIAEAEVAAWDAGVKALYEHDKWERLDGNHETEPSMANPYRTKEGT